MLISEPETSPTLSPNSQASNSLPSLVTLSISYTNPPLDHMSDLFTKLHFCTCCAHCQENFSYPLHIRICLILQSLILPLCLRR